MQIIDNKQIKLLNNQSSVYQYQEINLQEYFENELTTNGFGTFLKYRGTVHGFIVRPDGSSHVNQQTEKAVHDAVEYFKKNK